MSNKNILTPYYDCIGRELDTKAVHTSILNARRVVQGLVRSRALDTLSADLVVFVLEGGIQKSHGKVLATRTEFNLMPTIITGEGDYMTRNGHKVHIHTVHDHSDNYAVTKFNCKGRWRELVKVRERNRNGIWHECGRMYHEAESALDIVGVFTR